MSLINDMLRDLEGSRRHEQTGKKFSEIPMAVTVRSGLRRWVLFGVLALALAALAWLGVTFFILSPSNSTERTAQQEANLPTDNGSSPEVTSFEKPEMTTAEEQPVVSQPMQAAELPEPVAEARESIPTLLDLRVHEREGKIRLVLDFNGLPQYQLQLNGQEKTQLLLSFNGMHIGEDFRLSEQKGRLVGQISLQPREKRLQLLIELARKALVLGHELKAMEGAGYRLYVDLAAAAEPAKTGDLEPEQKPAVGKIAEPNKQSGEQIEEIKPPNESPKDAPLLSKSSKNLSPDLQAYRRGIKELQQDLGEAANSFNLALRLNPRLIEARLQLIRILEGQGNDLQTRELIAKGLDIAPGNRTLRKKRARQLLAERRLQEAISLLQNPPVPTVAEDVEYHALLAGLQQESKQYEAAAQNYMRLLQVRPQEAVWWLGLAVSMDQDGDFVQARKAYRQALALPGLSPDLQAYIEGRLQVL